VEPAARLCSNVTGTRLGFVDRLSNAASIVMNLTNGLRGLSLRLEMLSQNRPTAFALRCAATALIVLALAKSLQNAPSNFDIELSDESSYLFAGITRAQPLFLSYEQSGLYSAFYRLLSFAVPDPAALYVVQANIIVFATLLLIFVCLASLSRSLTFASLATGIFLLSPLPTIGPRVSLAAISVIALALTLAAVPARTSAVLAIIMVGAFLACFVRPEFVLAFYALAVMTVMAFGWDAWRSSSKTAAGSNLVLYLCLAAVALLSFLWSFPMLSDGSRAYVAFGQHFALRTVINEGSGVNPWINWEQMTGAVFPGATTVREAFVMSPGPFIEHMLANGWDTVKNVLHNYIRAMVTHWHFSRIVFLAAIGLLAAQIASASKARAVDPKSETEQSSWPLAVGIVVLMAPILFECVIIFPRHHYVGMLVFLLSCLLALRLRAFRNLDHPVILAASAASVLIIAPVIPVNPQPVFKIVRQLQAAPRITAMLEMDGGWCVYLPSPCRTIYAYAIPPGKSVKALVDENMINSIFVSPALLQYAPVAADPYFQALLGDPQKLGWSSLAMDSQNALLMRRGPD
jgi:hypothetical protein